MYNCNSEPISIGDAFQLERVSGAPEIASLPTEDATVDYLAGDLRTRLTEGKNQVSSDLNAQPSP